MAEASATSNNGHVLAGSVPTSHPTAIEQRFASAQPRLSYRRDRLIRQILEAPEEMYFLSARELARRLSVDAATIVRTVQALGYPGFSDFSADLRSYFIARITPYKIMKAAASAKSSIVARIERSFEADARNLAQLRSSLPPKRVFELARRIDGAGHVVVVGIDLAYSQATYLAYMLSWLGINAEAPMGSAGILQHRLKVMTPKDLLITISFGRCLRETVNAARSSRERGIYTFGMTDSDKSPLALTCDSHWVVSVTNATFNASYVSCMAAWNALLVACAHIRPKRSLEFVKMTDKHDSRRWVTDSRG